MSPLVWAARELAEANRAIEACDLSTRLGRQMRRRWETVRVALVALGGDELVFDARLVRTVAEALPPGNYSAALPPVTNEPAVPSGLFLSNAPWRAVVSPTIFCPTEAAREPLVLEVRQ